MKIMIDPDRFFDKDGKPITLDEFSTLISDEQYRKIKQETVGEYFVSTVWLGLDHSYGGGKKLIFETMVFDNRSGRTWTEDYQQRFSTQEEALKGHQNAVAYVNELLEKQQENDPTK